MDVRDVTRRDVTCDAGGNRAGPGGGRDAATNGRVNVVGLGVCCDVRDVTHRNVVCEI